MLQNITPLRVKVTAVFALLAFCLMTFSLPATAQTGRGGSRGALSVPLPEGATATLPGTTTATPLTGNFVIQRFIAQNGKIVALGTIVGRTASGQDVVLSGAQAEVTNITSLPTQSASVEGAPTGFQLAQAACPILNLTLGPIHLNVLGLVVDIPNPIVVNIVAQPGPGNLLGNLLCSVANLLNGGGGLSAALNQVVGLLNQILGALSGIA